jgi:hypothetical protein
MRCTIYASAFILATFSRVLAAEPTPLAGAVDSETPGPPELSSAHLAPGVELGMWVWHREEVIDPHERARLLEFCQTYGIGRIFVQVRFDRLPDGSFSLATSEAWQALLAAAYRVGIAVEALDGDNAMGFAENRPTTLAKLDSLLAFHRSQPRETRFSGIRYDIEPYTSARWRAGDEKAVMLEFLDTAAAMRAAIRAADPKLTLSFDIPAFYDAHDRFVIPFAGATKNFHQHIQDISDFIGVMSYRTHATGPNSVIAISEGELAYGKAIGRPVFLSLETVPLSDTPQITFHGRSAEEFRAAIREVSAQLSGNPAFGGLFLHQYRTIRRLLEPAPAHP